MRKWFWIACVLILVVGVVVAWMVLRWRPLEIPKDLYIPGLESFTEVDRNYEHINIIAKIKHLGTTYNCALELKIDQNGQLVLPNNDESFTVVVSDESNLELWRDDRKIGNVPVVFIAPRHDPGFYRVGPPGSSQRPIAVSSNMVNLVTYVFDTVIKSPESVMVKVLKNDKEIASGRIPLNLKLGDGEAKAVIVGVQIRGYAGTGAFQFFTGDFPIKKGVNSIVAAGRILGADLWHEDGVFLGTNSGYGDLNEDKVCFIGKTDKIVLLGKNRKEVIVGNIQFDRLYGYPIKNTSSVYVSSSNKLQIVDTQAKLTLDSNFQEFPAWISPFQNLLPIPKRRMGPILADLNRFMLDQFHITYQEGHLKCISQQTRNLLYSVKFHLPETAVLQRYNNNVIFFTDGNRSTEFMDIKTGNTGSDLKNLQKKEVLDWITGDGLVYPSGHRIKKGIVCLDTQGRTLWARQDGRIERIDTLGIKVTNEKTGEVSCYDVRNGQLLASWKNVDADIPFLDERYMVISVQGNHTIFVQRTIKP